MPPSLLHDRPMKDICRAKRRRWYCESFVPALIRSDRVQPTEATLLMSRLLQNWTTVLHLRDFFVGSRIQPTYPGEEGLQELFQRVILIALLGLHFFRLELTGVGPNGSLKSINTVTQIAHLL